MSHPFVDHVAFVTASNLCAVSTGTNATTRMCGRVLDWSVMWNEVVVVSIGDGLASNGLTALKRSPVQPQGNHHQDPILKQGKCSVHTYLPP